MGDDGPMRLDHLSYAAGPEGLAPCVQRIGSKLGAAFIDGGIHPSFGTRNFVLALRGGCYLEIVAPLDHPAADRAPFGRAVRSRAKEGGGWLTWAIGVDDIGPVEARLGRSAAPGHRRRPDGFDLRWQQIGLNDVSVDPELPYFIRWITDRGEHPSVGASPVTLRLLEISGDPARVSEFVASPAVQPLEDVEVLWLDPSEQETGLVAAVFATATGTVRID